MGCRAPVSSCPQRSLCRAGASVPIAQRWCEILSCLDLPYSGGSGNVRRSVRVRFYGQRGRSVGGPEPAARPLITPALFSHRPPPDREKRERIAWFVFGFFVGAGTSPAPTEASRGQAPLFSRKGGG